MVARTHLSVTFVRILPVLLNDKSVGLPYKYKYIYIYIYLFIIIRATLRHVVDPSTVIYIHIILSYSNNFILQFNILILPLHILKRTYNNFTNVSHCTTRF